MCVLLVLFIFISLIDQLKTYDVISIVPIESCNQSSYFDSMSHICKSCGPFQKRSEDQLSCECEIGYYPGFDEKSKKIECLRCDDNSRSVLCLKVNLICDFYDIKGLHFTYSFD